MRIAMATRMLFVIAAVAVIVPTQAAVHNVRHQFTAFGGELWLNCSLPMKNYITYRKVQPEDNTEPKIVVTRSGISVSTQSGFSMALPEAYGLFDKKHLRIKPARWEEAGVYQCLEGADTDEVVYSVTNAITVHHLEGGKVTVKTSERSLLSCSILVKPGDDETKDRVSINWLIGGKPHTGITRKVDLGGQYGLLNVSNELNVQLSQTDDGQSASCRLVDEDNTVIQEGKAKLDVLYPPFGVTLSSTTVKTIFKEGDRVHLKCLAAGAKPPVYEYRWMKQGKEVSETLNHLVIENIRKEDAGEYRCTAINDIGEETVTQRIQVKYLRVNAKASSSSVLEGNSVTITCEAEGLPETFTFGMWRHSSTNGIMTYLPRTIGNARIEIPKIQYSQGGTYCCSCSNNDFNMTGCDDVEVKFSPKVDVFMPREFEVGTGLGQNRSLVLHIVANPSATEFEWYTGLPPGSSLIHHEKYWSNATTSILKFPKVAEEDYGNYTCKAKNDVGSTYFVFQLKKPAPASPPDNVRISGRTAISLYVSWESAFNGGRPQVFHLFYKPTNTLSYESRWNILDPGQQKTVTVKLTNLAPGSEYDVQVQSKSALSTERDGLSPVIKTSTKVRPAKPHNVTIVRESRTAIVSWTRIHDNITAIGVQYCVGVKCDLQKVPRDSTYAEIEVDEDVHYSFQLLLYDGEDVVQTSETLNKQSVTKAAPGADVAGIIVGVVILALVIVIVAVVIVQRKKHLKKKGKDIESDDSFDSDHELEIIDKDREPESTDMLLERTPNNNMDDPSKDSTVHVVVAQMSFKANGSAAGTGTGSDLCVELPRKNSFKRADSFKRINSQYKDREDTVSLKSNKSRSSIKPPRPPPPSQETLKRRSLVYADLSFDSSPSKQGTPVRKKSLELEYASIDFGNTSQKQPMTDTPSATPTKKPGDNLSFL